MMKMELRESTSEEDRRCILYRLDANAESHSFHTPSLTVTLDGDYWRWRPTIFTHVVDGIEITWPARASVTVHRLLALCTQHLCKEDGSPVRLTQPTIALVQATLARVTGEGPVLTSPPRGNKRPAAETQEVPSVADPVSSTPTVEREHRSSARRASTDSSSQARLLFLLHLFSAHSWPQGAPLSSPPGTQQSGTGLWLTSEERSGQTWRPTRRSRKSTKPVAAHLCCVKACVRLGHIVWASRSEDSVQREGHKKQGQGTEAARDARLLVHQPGPPRRGSQRGLFRGGG